MVAMMLCVLFDIDVCVSTIALVWDSRVVRPEGLVDKSSMNGLDAKSKYQEQQRAFHPAL